MESVGTLVIGAGAVGLAIAAKLSETDPDLVIVDKESSFGKHTSSRNSEVIHAGHYYPTGSLKAKLCVEGNKLLYAYLEKKGIPYKNTGKIIVATNAAEIDSIMKYYDLGIKNGCAPFKVMSKEEVIALEPLVKCVAGLYVPSTGIFDTHSYMADLADSIEANDAFIVYGAEVISIEYLDGAYMVKFANGDTFSCQRVINSAGLWADKIAEMVGIDVVKHNLKLHLCKGEYYKTTKVKGVSHLIYPVADPSGVFLGIHLTINLAGDIRFGPNAYYQDKIDYRFDEDYFADFVDSIDRYLDVNTEDIMPDDTGIRPKLQGPGDGVRDFYIKEETEKGYTGFINLIGIESPGLTASLAIAKIVADLVVS